MMSEKSRRRAWPLALLVAGSLTLTGCVGVGFPFPQLGDLLGEDVSMEDLEQLEELFETLEEAATFTERNHDPGLPGGVSPESSTDGANEGTGKSNESTFDGDVEGALDEHYGKEIGPPSESSEEEDGSWKKRWETDGVQVDAEYDAETGKTTVKRHWHDGTAG